MGTKKVQRVIKKTFEICPTAFPYFIPKKAKEGSIGYDLVCPVDFHVPAHSRVAIPLNFAINLPFGVEAKIEARSGMTLRGMEGYGTRVKWGWKWGFIPWRAMQSGRLNFDADVMPGKIDPNFTDSINIILKNNDVAFTIKARTRIAQMTFYSTIAPYFEVVPQLSCKSRGGGLGSSGSEATSEAARQAVVCTGTHSDCDDVGQPKDLKSKDKALRAEYWHYRKLVEEAGLTPLPYYRWVEIKNRGEQSDVKGVSFNEWFDGLTLEKQEEVKQTELFKILHRKKDAEQNVEK